MALALAAAFALPLAVTPVLVSALTVPDALAFASTFTSTVVAVSANEAPPWLSDVLIYALDLVVVVNGAVPLPNVPLTSIPPVAAKPSAESAVPLTFDSTGTLVVGVVGFSADMGTSPESLVCAEPLLFALPYEYIASS